MNKNIHKIRRS